MRSLTIALFLLATPALADVTGVARVIDGDSLELAGERIRLHGIDAPESRQSCLIDSRRWQCGIYAAKILADFINNRPVTCDDLGRDRYERIIARCTVADDDIGSWMVSEELALAYRRYSLDYLEEEADAQAARRGIWATEFVKPWEWRRGKRLAANDNAPTLCEIKGNINARGERIYHIPGQQAYKMTRVNPGKGERWFCSEAQAKAAGWRKALR
ncbi:MAG: thermonuclease family protein [Proteobacteria bacterium]|nr:thermonuclease family protein [Pseudomonadota bacterium]